MSRLSITRSPRLWSLYGLCILGLLFAWGFTRLSALAAPDPVTAAWQQAQAAGSYHFHASVTQTTIPAATVTNVGRPSTQRSFALEGQTDLPEQRLQLRLWDTSQGQQPDATLELQAEAGHIQARTGDGPWEELTEFPDLFAPGGDVLAYLAAVRDPIEVGRETRAGRAVTRYSFTLDGPQFAAHLRNQTEQQLRQQGKLPPGVTLDAAQAYQDLSGQGELWVDTRGLPLRQILTIEFAGRDGQQVVGQLNVDFSGYGTGGTLALFPTAAQIQAALASWGLPLLVVGGFVMLLIGYRRPWMRSTVAVGLCVVLVLGPFQTQLQTAELGTAQAAEAEEHVDQQEQQEVAKQFRATITDRDYDPHRNPLTAVRGTASTAGATGSDTERQQAQAQPLEFTCYEATFQRLDKVSTDLPSGQYWLHIDGFQRWQTSFTTGGPSISLPASTTYPFCVMEDETDDIPTEIQVRVRHATASTTTLYDADEYATGLITLDDQVTGAGSITLTELVEGTAAPSPITIHYAITQKQPEELNDLIGDDATDSDLDGLTDWQESKIGTEPVDKVEVRLNGVTVGTIEGLDSDGDGLTDLQEVAGFTYAGKQWYTDPLAIDSNGDGRDDGLEWGIDDNGEPLATPVDLDSDNVPDLFDEDDDGDRVPDTLDTSVAGASDLNQPYTEQTPFTLQLDNLEANKPTYVDLQFRPTDPEHLQFALSVLDWPEGDRRGQVQDNDGQTYADRNGDNAAANDADGDMKLIPMLQVEIAGAPSFLPLLKTPAYTVTLDPLTPGAAAVTGTVRLAQQSGEVTVSPTLSVVDAATTQLQIVAATCTKLDGATVLHDALSASAGSTLSGISLLTEVVQSGHSVVLVQDDAPQACAGLPDLVFDQVDGQDKMIDTAFLRTYGISVHEIGTSTPRKQLHVPALSVADPETGAQVAFASKLFLQRPNATAPAPEIETRFIWGVQMLQDFCTDYENNECSDYGATNAVQLLHHYFDAWYLTGLDVREEQGSAAAIIYEDPAQKADALNYHNSLVYLSDYLSSNLDLPGLTVDSLPARFDYTLNSTATTTETVGLSDLSDLNILRVETFTGYNHRDALLGDIVNNHTPDVLNRAGQPNATGGIDPLDQHIPLLLFLRSETYDSVPALTTLGAQGDGLTWDGARLRVDFAEDTPVVGKAVNWAPFAYDGIAGAWDSYAVEEYYEAMEVLYPAETFGDGPTPVLDLGEQEAYQFLTQLYFLTLYSGRESVLLPELQIVFTAEEQTATELEWLRSRLGYVEDQNNLFRAWADDFAELYTYTNNRASTIRSIVLPKSLNTGKLPFTKTSLTSIGHRIAELEATVRQVRDQGQTLQISRQIQALQAQRSTLSWRVGVARGFWAGFVILATLYAFAVFLTPQGRDAVLGTEEGRIATAVIVGSMLTYIGIYKPAQLALLNSRLAAIGATASTAAKATRNLRIATAVFTLIALAIAVGFFVHSYTSGNLNEIQKKAAIAAFTGSAVLIIVLAIISAIPPWGPVIAGVIGLIDFLVSLFAPEWSLSQFLVGFDYELIVGSPEVDLNPSTKLVDIPRGYTVGNQVRVSSPVSVTIESTTPKKSSWRARSYATDYWDRKNVKDTSVTYSFGQAPAVPLLRPMNGEWQNEQYLGSFGPPGRARGKRYRYDTVYPISLDVPLTQAGLDQELPLYLNSNTKLPSVECWSVLFVPWCERTNYNSENQTYIGGSPSFVFDIFPQTLDEFRTLTSAGNGGLRLALDERFPALRDADGDGLVSTAYNGNDPNDADWDTDDDGLTDRTELQLREAGRQFSPLFPDTDGDGLFDQDEVRNGTDPAKADTDGDGLEDNEEVLGWTITITSTVTDPLLVQVTSDPLDPDADLDGINDKAEQQLAARGYNPNVFDRSPLALYVATDDLDGIVGPGQTVRYTTTVVSELTDQQYDALSLQTDLAPTLGGGLRTATLALSATQTTDAIGFDLTVPTGVTAGSTALTSTLRAQLPGSGDPNQLIWQTNPANPSVQRAPYSLLTSPQSAERGDRYVVASQLGSGLGGNGDIQFFTEAGSARNLDQDNEASYPQSNAYWRGAGPAQVACTADGTCLTVWDHEDRCNQLIINSIAIPYDGDANRGGDYKLHVVHNQNDRTPIDGGYDWIYWRVSDNNINPPDQSQSRSPISFCDSARLSAQEWDGGHFVGNNLWQQQPPVHIQHLDWVGENLQDQGRIRSVMGTNADMTIRYNSFTSNRTTFFGYFVFHSFLFIPMPTPLQVLELNYTIPAKQLFRVAGAVTNPNGTVRRSQFDLDVAAPGTVDTAPAIASDGGQFLAVWQRSGAIWARPFDTSGNALGAAQQLQAVGQRPQVIWAGDRYLVAWERTSTGQIELQGVAADGTPLGTPVAVGAGRAPRLAYDPLTREVLLTALVGNEITAYPIELAQPINVGPATTTGIQNVNSHAVAYEPFQQRFVLTWRTTSGVVQTRALNLADVTTGLDVATFATTSGAPSLSCPAPSAVPVADWRFEELAAVSPTTQFSDQSTSNRTLSCSGANCPTAGALARSRSATNGDSNRALFFDGQADGLTAAGDDLGGGSLTVSAWTQRAATATAATLFSQGNGLRFGFTANNELTCQVGSATATSAALNGTTDWQQWACSYDATNGQVTLFQNGQALARGSGTAAPYSGTGPVHLGQNANGSDRFQGFLDDVVIHRVALSTQTLQDQYNERQRAYCLAAAPVSVNNIGLNQLTLTDTFVPGGLIEQAATVPLLVDTQRPTAAISLTNAYLQPVGTLTVGGTANDNSQLDRVEIRLDAGDWQSANGTAAWSFTLPLAGLAEGEYTIAARAVDAADLVSDSVTRTFFIDDSAPDATVDLNELVPGSGIVAVQPTQMDNSWQLTLAGTASDPVLADSNPGSGVATVEVALEGPAGNGWQAATLQSDGTWSLDYVFGGIGAEGQQQPDPSGFYTLQVRTTDAVGNESEGWSTTGSSIEAGATLAGTRQLQLALDAQAPTTELALNTALTVTELLTEATTLQGTVADGKDFDSGAASVEVAFVPAEQIDATQGTGTDLVLPFDAAPGTTSFANEFQTDAPGICDAPACPTTTTDGRQDGAAVFDGLDDRVIVQQPTSTISSTLAAWVLPTATGQTMTIVQLGADQTAHHELRLAVDGTPEYVVGTATARGTGSLPLNTWSQLVGVTHADGTLELFVDGQVTGTAGPITPPAASTHLVVGATQQGTAFFAGRLDEITRYSRALIAEEVQALFQAADTRWYTATLTQPRADDSTGWELPLPTDLDGIYQINVRATDQLGNRTAQRYGQGQWRGEIDTAAPRLTMDIRYSGSGAALQAIYTCTAEDWNLDPSSLVCPLPPAATTSCSIQERTFYDSTWWRAVVGLPAQLVAVTANCQQPAKAGVIPQAKVCDMFGQCTTVDGSAAPSSSHITRTVALLTPTAGLIGHTDPLTLTAVGQAPQGDGIDTLSLLVDETALFTETVTISTTNTVTSTATWQPVTGTHILAARAVFADGTVQTSAPVTVTVDLTPPLVTLHPTTMVTSAQTLDREIVTLTGTVQSALDVQVDVQVGPTTARPAAVDAEDWQALWPLPRDRAERDGVAYPVLVQAQDTAERTNSVTTTLLIDTEPPTLVQLTAELQDATGRWRGLVANQQLGLAGTTLRLRWAASTDGSGVARYAAGWSPTSEVDIATLTPIAVDGLREVTRDLPAATEEEDWYAHVASWDRYGNLQVQTLGPIVRTPNPDPPLDVTKTATLVADVDGDGQATVGDTVEWQVVLHNPGTEVLRNWTLRDELADALALVPGRVTSTAGAIDLTEANRVEVTGNELAAGDEVRLVLQTVITRAPGAEVQNQVWARAVDYNVTGSDDPTTPLLGDATVVAVAEDVIGPMDQLTPTDTTLLRPVPGPVTPGDSIPLEPSPETTLPRVYLPLVVSQPTVPNSTPPTDVGAVGIALVPNQTTFTAGEPVEVRVTLTNTGTSATTRGFWVDLMIDPTEVPTGTSGPRRWDEACGTRELCLGLAWVVPAGLAPGEQVTLVSRPARTAGGGEVGYAEEYSVWPGWFAAGTERLYAVVDGWNPAGAPGVVGPNGQAVLQLDGLTVSGENPPFPAEQEPLQPERPIP